MKIELGQKNDSTGCCAPSPVGDSEMHYPSLYFTHDKPLKFPKEGTAVITFRKVESTENDRDPENPKYRCELEVHSIDVKGGEDDGMVSVKDAMKDAMRKKLKKGEYEEGE